jgi:hypothetical protein
MTSFVISKMNFVKRKYSSSDFNVTQLNLSTDFDIISVDLNEHSNILNLEIQEFVVLNFNYLNEPVHVPLKTKSLINLNTGLMLSSPSGIGILSKGGTKKYVDSYIGKVIAKIFFDDESLYSSVYFNESQMNPDDWGNDIRYLKFNLHDIGNCVLTGKDLKSKITDVNSIFEFDNISKIQIFKVYSNKLKRTVTVSYNGIVKVNNEDLFAVYSYIVDSLNY